MGLPQTGSFPIYVQTACDFTEHDSETTGSERAQEEHKACTYIGKLPVCGRPFTIPSYSIGSFAHRPLAPQGSTSPFELTGNPISSDLT